MLRKDPANTRIILKKALKAKSLYNYTRAVELLRPLAGRDIADAQRILAETLHYI